MSTPCEMESALYRRSTVLSRRLETGGYRLHRDNEAAVQVLSVPAAGINEDVSRAAEPSPGPWAPSAPSGHDAALRMRATGAKIRIASL